MDAPRPSPRLGPAAVALVAILAVVAGCSSGGTPRRVTGGATAADPSPAQVAGRPWPDRVTPTGPWSASMRGTGPRLTLTMGGIVVGGLDRATVDLGTPAAGEPTSGRALVLPGGERWYPQEPFRVENEGDMPFALLRRTPDSGGAYALSAAGGEVTVLTSFDALLAAAGGEVRARGEFVRGDGARSGELTLTAGTTLAAACADRATTTTAAGPPCPADTEGLVTATVEAGEGTVVRAAGDGEVAVAARAGVGVEAAGHGWEGQVVAVEGAHVEVEASFDGRQWSVAASVDDGRQVWVDVWPVVDTVLEARSYSVAPGFFDRNRLLKVEWANIGFATAQILEAEGTGPGAAGVGFDLNKTLGHDAGLGVRRGDVVGGFRGGADVDSNLPAGGRTNRELSYAAGSPATLVLRGNFPEVRVELAVPGT